MLRSSQPRNPTFDENTFDVSSFLDITRPNLARIFNYLAGGATHFDADRVAADEMLSQFPPLKKWVQVRDAFSYEAVHILNEAGFKQFLDIGSGMPSNDAIHRLVPAATFLYCDINPIAVTYGSSLFAELEQVSYAYGDARNIASLLQSDIVAHMLQQEQKVAIGLNNLPLFLSHEELANMAQLLFDWAAPNSQLFVFLQSRADTKGLDVEYRQFESKLLQIGLPINIDYLNDVIKVFAPWRVDLLEPIPSFMGLPPKFFDHTDGLRVGMQFHALFLIK